MVGAPRVRLDGKACDMVSTLRICEDLRDVMDERAAEEITHHMTAVYEGVQRTPTKADFTELKQVVQALAEAQVGSESRLGGLTLMVGELSRAQARSEESLKNLAGRVDELAGAQRRTQASLDSLMFKMEELAQAQRQTEMAIQTLHTRMKHTEENIGGLSHTVGYRLEDEAIWRLPPLLKHDMGIDVEGCLRRDWLAIPGEKHPLEVKCTALAGGVGGVGRPRRGQVPVEKAGRGRRGRDHHDQLPLWPFPPGPPALEGPARGRVPARCGDNPAERGSPRVFPRRFPRSLESTAESDMVLTASRAVGARSFVRRDAAFANGLAAGYAVCSFSLTSPLCRDMRGFCTVLAELEIPGCTRRMNGDRDRPLRCH